VAKQDSNKTPFINYSEDEFKYKRTKTNQRKNKRKIKQALRTHDWENMSEYDEDRSRKK
jgi:hypothetical protein